MTREAQFDPASDGAWGPRDRGAPGLGTPDSVSVLRWFAAYGVFLLVAGAWLGVLLSRYGWEWSAWVRDFTGTFRATPRDVKLLVTLIYLTVCTTFLPLPANALVAFMGTRQAALASNVWAVTLIVGIVGAAGSTIANLNDYHLLTWLLRWRRISAVRNTRFYGAAARWFAKSAFFILTLFSMLPIPIDVIRLLAITNRYGRAKFAGANFIGRFVRYALIAFVTYQFDLGNWAALFLLALAVALAIGKGLLHWISKQRDSAKPQAGA